LDVSAQVSCAGRAPGLSVAHRSDFIQWLRRQLGLLATGMRQSMPSRARQLAGGHDTLPMWLSQMKRSLNSLANSISPWPSNHSTLRMSRPAAEDEDVAAEWVW